MTTAQVPSHPLLAAVETTRKALAGVAEVEPVYLAREVKQAALLELVAAESQLVELRLRVLAASDDVAEQTAHRDAGAWLADRANLDRPATHADLKLAQALDAKYARVGEAMRAGVVNRAQAVVVVHALDKLPVDVDQLAKKRAERHLVELAEHHTPKELRVLGEHLLEVIAPDVAEEALGKALEREEQRARIKTSLRLRAQGEGTTRITILCPDAAAARLETYLEAATSPRVVEPVETRLPRHRALGQAFVAMLEHLDTSKLPDHGGDATTVIVTVPLGQLTKDLGVAGLMGGLGGEVSLTASQARRLACNAKILPAVLGGKGEVLDLGRAKRLFSPAQRKAMRLRDKQCRAEGCGIPATWTEAHHVKPWSKGGRTDLADGVLLCSHHHHRAHDARYQHQLLPNGDWRFHLRT